MPGLGMLVLLELQGTGSGLPVSVLGPVSVELKDQFTTDTSDSQMAALQHLAAVPHEQTVLPTFIKC
jgi:hypothetical protein